MSPRKQAQRLRPVAAAALLCLAATAHAQVTPTAEGLALQWQKLAERVEQLEARNRQLEDRVRQLTTRDPAAGTPPSSAAALPAPALPPLPVAPSLDSEDEAAGPSIEGGLVAVAQQVGRRGGADGLAQSRLNFRGDIEATVPLGALSALGESRLSGFGHLRFGQGAGIGLRPSHTATANSVPFEGAGGGEETYAIVAQAWVQATWPLGGSGLNDLPGNRVELTVGKMDVFGFFDQNAVAGDEGAQFLNNVFVHNPLLDSGGDLAADAYGLAPGLRLAWIDEGEDRGWGWGVSAGVFASGAGAGFNADLTRPLAMVQVEWVPKQINGEPRGAYRLYGWSNGNTVDLGGQRQRHTGWGVSVDQRLGRDWNLFGRWGQRTAGAGTFDRALTLGFEHGGRAWGRSNDALGLALGWLRTDARWAEATVNDPLLAGYGARGHEQLAELYYRFKLNEHVQLSPDLQVIQRAGGDGAAPRFAVWGLRASLGF